MDAPQSSAPGPRARASGRSGILGLVTSRPVAVTMLQLSLTVFGLVSLFKLRQDLLPDISYPSLTVRTSWPGSAPEDVEQRVSTRVQEALSTLPGLVRQSSTSRAGVSDVALEFAWNTEMAFAVQDVREKLDGVFLPNGAERPLILRYDPSLDPILRVGLTRPPGRGGVDPEEDLIALRWLAENRLERELEAIEGVAAVDVRGGLEEEIRVRLDPAKLAAQKLDMAEIGARLAAENINASGGSLREGSTEYIVRTVNEFQDLEEVRQLALVRRAGASVRLADVGSVEAGYKRREVVSRIDGQEAVELAIYREAGANIVELAERVRAKIFGTKEQQAAAKEQLAGDGQEALSGDSFASRQQTNFLAHELRRDGALTLLSDQSVFIEDAIGDVKSSAVTGSALAIGIILLFLRSLQPTLIIAISIPISVIVAFACMFLGGVSLNIMSLGGLALGVGMLVDNAIVVLESITRCREEGDELKAAAIRGTREVAGAVTASTLTTVAVFAPIVFVSGVAGQIFGDQALTVVSALSVSLIVALFYIPMLASRSFAPLSGRPPKLWDPQPGEHKGHTLRRAAGGLLAWSLAGPVALVALLVGGLVKLLGLVLRPIAVTFEAGYGLLERGYPALLKGTLRMPLVLLGLSAALLFFSQQRLGRLGVELLPEIHQGEFTAFVQLFVGSPLDNTDRVLSGLEARVRALPEVAATALTAGVETETLSRDVEGSHTGRLTVRMRPESFNAEAEEQLAESVRNLLAAHPAVRSVEVRRPTPFALAAPIAIEVRGHDLEQLAVVSKAVEARLTGLPGLADLKSSLRPGQPELALRFDREKTLEYGLDLAGITAQVRSAVLGDVPTRLTRGDERIDLRVQADEASLETLEDVLDLAVDKNRGQELPLRAVAEIELVDGPAEIRRVGNTRAIVLEARTQGLDLGGLTRSIETALADLSVPEGVTVEMGGQKREMVEAQDSMIFALLLAVFLVYVVMAAQFESLLQPLIILISVPLAGIGVIWVLEWTGLPLSVVVFIGLILLAGIVVNNAIVLIDRINQNRRAGLGLEQSVIEAARTRLRPILMTTLTTVLGLLPMTGWLDGLPLLGALGGGAAAEMRAPMAITVITGLSSSTLLTLFVIPAAYVLLERLADLVRRPSRA
jgi:hydrophobic/amphiphilic exporter-1 (mainly G- bacteria), HAE1 family